MPREHHQYQVVLAQRGRHSADRLLDILARGLLAPLRTPFEHRHVEAECLEAARNRVDVRLGILKIRQPRLQILVNATRKALAAGGVFLFLGRRPDPNERAEQDRNETARNCRENF